tara:strand:- start:399 stop:998 length:600 start_codon:yes stop_codon:yes gene_type:complete
MPIQRAKPKFSDVKNVSIAAANLPAGSIIKTETTPFTDFGTISLTTTQNETDIPGTEKSFTRTLSNSKILVQYNLKCTSYATAYLNLQRKIGSGSYATVSTGATGTQNGRTSNKQLLGAYYNNTSVNAMGYGIHGDFYQFLDSTSTGLTNSSDAITYKITGYSSSTSFDLHINIDGYTPSHANYHNTVESSVTFMEIKV